MKVFSKKVITDFVQDKSYQLPPGVLSRWSTYLSFTEEPNRNARLYDKGFWEEIIKQPMFQEKVRTKTLFGELEHPFIEDRMDSINPDRVSHSIVDVEVDSKGIKGVLDVLDTPCGRILDTFLRYGSKVGVSTRGMGEEEPRPGDGYLVPIRSSYDLITWDAVLTPAFDKCRPDALKDSFKSRVMFDGMQKMTKAEQRAVLTTLGFTRTANRETRAGEDMIESYRSAGKALQSLVDNLTGRVKVSGAVNKKLQEENRQLKNQLAIVLRQQRQIGKMDALVDSGIQETVSLRKLVRDLRGKIKRLVDEVRELERGRSELLDSNKELRRERRDLTDRINQSDQKVSRLQSKMKIIMEKRHNMSDRYQPVIAESIGEDSGADVTNLIKQRGRNL